MCNLQSVFAAITLSLFSSYFVLAQTPQQPPAPPAPMTFFVTSVGVGNGAKLGGLAGADAHCLKLATAVGAGNRTWRAYLSTQASGSQAAVHARDRIGSGPWHNAKGELVAQNVADLHGDIQRDRNNLHKATALNEKGEVVSGRGDTPNRHDILTGSKLDGTAYPAGDDMTCRNWTSSDAGKARVGHHDRANWISAHDTGGCSQESLRPSGGDGLFYCFVAAE